MMSKKSTLSKEEILFKNNFSLILRKSSKIIETPEFYNCKPHFIGMANPYAAPKLTLGNLCQLWAKGKFKIPCHTCGNTLYLVSGYGNLGGGISSRTGFCPYCESFYSEKGGSLYVGPMLSVYFQFRKEDKFEPYVQVSGVDFEILIKNLS